MHHVEFVIVGAGLSGLAMALALQQAGLHDFVILERAEQPGGTWWHHRYPGAACDVHAHLYQFSRRPRADWPRAYATRDEILAYLHRCVADAGLGTRLRCGAELIGGHWDEAGARWHLQLRGGGTLAARFVLLSAAPLQQPRLPAIEGLGRFAGDLLHTSRWDEQLALSGRRVGVIGTAASAVQIVPALAPRVRELMVFQRTPNWLLPRWDFAYPRWVQRTLAWPAPGRWHHAALRAGYDALHAGFQPGSATARAVARLCRWQLQRQVRDPALRQALTPAYPLGCKRVLVSSDYYPALQQAQVRLETTPVAAATPQGLRLADGRECALDLIVCATGFDDPRAAPAMALVGAEGRSLAQAWARGVGAHLGLAVPGFPNLFLLYGPHTQSGHVPAPCFVEAQADFVVRAHRALQAQGAASLRVRPAVHAAWDRALQSRLGAGVWAAGCSSWYLDAQGRNHAIWPGRLADYRRELQRPIADDYEFRPRHPPVA